MSSPCDLKESGVHRACRQCSHCHHQLRRCRVRRQLDDALSEGVHSLVDSPNELLRLLWPPAGGPRSISSGSVTDTSTVLMENISLLIGKTARKHVRYAICRIAGEDDAIRTGNGILTVQIGPYQVRSSPRSAEFKHGLTTAQIESSIRRIEARIRESHPEVTALFAKPQTPETWRDRRGWLGTPREPSASQRSRPCWIDSRRTTRQAQLTGSARCQ